MPRQCDVRDPSAALAYLVDCTLATVEGMAMKKSRAKFEYERQQGIAQAGVDWLISFGCFYADTRVADVVAAGGSVAEWAKKYEVAR